MGTTTTAAITKQPGRCGGAACVRGTRTTVWGLVSWRRLGLSDDAILATVPGLTRADLAAAWKYAAENADEIDGLIAP